MTIKQVEMRSKMYVDSATQAFEQGKAASAGIPRLPAYPGDGSTVCRANCKCSWQIKETDAAWECTWSLGAAEHCPDCIGNARRWSPLIVPKGLARNV